MMNRARLASQVALAVLVVDGATLCRSVLHGLGYFR